MQRLYLKTPEINDLSYRQHLLADEATMEYNAGYDLGIDGYIKEKGTIEFGRKKWQNWGERWLTSNDKFSGKFYAYLIDKETDMPVGDVGIRYDDEFETYITHIVVEAKYRGKGYAQEGLTLLIDKAFNDFNLPELADDIPEERTASIKLFKKLGFVYSKKDIHEIKWGKKQKVKLMVLKNPKKNKNC